MTTRGRMVAGLTAVMALFMIAGAVALRRPANTVRLRNATAPVPFTHIIRRLNVISSGASDPLGAFSISPHGLSWSPDGRLFAATPDIGGDRAWIWNADGSLAYKIKRNGHYPAFYPRQNIAFVDGGSRILLPPSSNILDTMMSLYDLRTETLLRDVPGPWLKNSKILRNEAVAIVPSPDQTMVAVLHSTFEPQPVSLYSTRDWQLVVSLQDTEKQNFNPSISLVFSSDGRQLAVGQQDGSVIIYNTKSGQVAQRINAFTQPLHYAPVWDVCFSPDGQYIAVGAWATGSVNILSSGRTPPDSILTPITQPYPLQVFRISDGKSVASAPGQKASIWDVKWSPRDRLIAFVGGDDLPRLWDPFGSEAPRVIPDLGKSFDLAFSPDGSILAVSQHLRISFVAVNNQR